MTELRMVLLTSGIVSFMSTSWTSRYVTTSVWKNKWACATSSCSITTWEGWQWVSGVTSTSSIWEIRIHFIQCQDITGFSTLLLLTDWTLVEPLITKFPAISFLTSRERGCRMELRDVQHFGETSVLGEELVSLQDFNFVFFWCSSGSNFIERRFQARHTSRFVRKIELQVQQDFCPGFVRQTSIARWCKLLLEWSRNCKKFYFFVELPQDHVWEFLELDFQFLNFSLIHLVVK